MPNWRLFGLGGLAVAVGYCGWHYVRIAWARRRGRRPPGPWGVPVLGSLPFVGEKYYEYFSALHDLYGPVYAIDFGAKRMVVIGDRAIANEVLKRPEVSGRTVDVSTEAWRDAGTGIFFRDADATWRFVRRHAMKAFAMVSSAHNSRMSAAVSDAVEEFKRLYVDGHEGEPIQIREPIMQLTGSAISHMVLGKPTNFERPEEAVIYNFVTTMVDDMMELMVVGMLPWLSIFFRAKLKEQRRKVAELGRLGDAIVDSVPFDGTVRTVADAVKSVAASLSDEDLAAVGLSRRRFLRLTVDLYASGIFDTAENIIWLLIILGAHPEAQERCVQELSAQVGLDRPVESGDQTRLPYCVAAMTESLRFACTAGIGVGHKVVEETRCGPWILDPGTEVIMNTWRLMRGKDAFEEATTFRPERFLSEDGSLDPSKANCLAIFGAGSRRCIGEAFAKQEIFVAAYNILRTHRVAVEAGKEAEALSHTAGLTIRPGTNILIFHRR